MGIGAVFNSCLAVLRGLESELREMATTNRRSSKGDLCNEVPALLDAKLRKTGQGKAEAKNARWGTSDSIYTLFEIPLGPRNSERPVLSAARLQMNQVGICLQ